MLSLEAQRDPFWDTESSATSLKRAHLSKRQNKQSKNIERVHKFHNY
jgi:hypothetical protein